MILKAILQLLKCSSRYKSLRYTDFYLILISTKITSVSNPGI